VSVVPVSLLLTAWVAAQSRGSSPASSGTANSRTRVLPVAHPASVGSNALTRSGAVLAPAPTQAPATTTATLPTANGATVPPGGTASMSIINADEGNAATFGNIMENLQVALSAAYGSNNVEIDYQQAVSRLGNVTWPPNAQSDVSALEEQMSDLVMGLDAGTQTVPSPDPPDQVAAAAAAAVGHDLAYPAT
jgi:hypothetical protein